MLAEESTEVNRVDRSGKNMSRYMPTVVIGCQTCIGIGIQGWFVVLAYETMSAAAGTNAFVHKD